jgi:hypothetical protein
VSAPSWIAADSTSAACISRATRARSMVVRS